MKSSTRRRAGAIVAATLLASLMSATPPAHAAPVEHITNGTFDSGTAPWWSSANTALTVNAGRACADVPAGSENPWDVMIGHNDIPLVNGARYTLTFTASASTASTVRTTVQLNEEPYTAPLSREVALTPAAQTFTYTFTSDLDSTNSGVTFQIGAPVPFTFCLDDVSLSSEYDGPPAGGPEQVKNGRFDQGTAGWFTYGTTSSGVRDGEFCADVPGGLAQPWDAGLGQSDITLLAGSEYAFSFDASADPGATIRVTVQLGAEPFTSYLGHEIPIPAAGAHYEYSFTATEDTHIAQVAFQVGGNAAAYTMCVDNVSLRGGEEVPPYAPDTGPRVRVNQTGYLPNGPKHATLVTESTVAMPWQLRDAAGAVVALGQTTPRGVDQASGQNVHTIDFSGYGAAATGYTLVADGEASYPFDISGSIYRQLRSDTLQFFYIQRSGIAIDGALVGEQYARPAGHLGVAPNQGDTDVPCQPGVCDYRLDVRGGWYDAGDQGKYVVNGGMASAQLMGAFERTKTAPTGGFGAALGDSTLRVPERGNGVPDVLDEARWELEFMLRMQVPDGKPKAGMVFHKVHDRVWTGLPMQPQDDPQPRELHPPSTSATLNLAAAAAQAARLFAPYDKAFADRALAAAKKAYAAAKANPAIYADPSDGNGGGAYNDNDVTDEFYWAAAELYLTTGEAGYLADVTASPHNTANPFSVTGFHSAAMAAVARLDLATVPSGLPAGELTRIRRSVLDAADSYLDMAGAQAYGMPMLGHAGAYFWGGNGNLLNSITVLATAFDISGQSRYRDGAVEAIDYLLGRNALNQSYVTGWGEKASKNQHSRIYGNQLDPALPNPPAGSLAGGANSFLDDAFAQQLLAGCKPMFCYVDDINSYSTNEVAINWNSALAWMASFLDDQGADQPVAAPTCSARYVNYGTWPEGGGFTTQVEVTNTGTTTIDGWTMRFAFTGDQRVRESWSGRSSQSGATVTVLNESWNSRIQPGATVFVGFNATMGGRYTNPNPRLLTINGTACTVQ
ncbi:glycoside hydrolase family 9 protein [Rhizomonospora bruguierae]|uniref:glycoside hydrolase family 9 protein n=1 Tax=Rhizomonospora bruguierae TaxID=1581705 RepID=UPI0020C0B515|nr:glycoside hydrolase family 9 protein [Micromonospora sp. NBRC 107566]